MHQNLFNRDGKLVGHGTFTPDEGRAGRVGPARESTEFQDLVKRLALEAAMRVAVAAAPHVERWLVQQALPAAKTALTQQAVPAVKSAWSNQALPAMRSTWNFVSRKQASRDAIAAESVPAPDPIRVTATLGEEPSRELARALESFGAGGGEVDARERFVAALMAQLLSEDGRFFHEVQARVLRNAGVEDLDEVGVLGPEQISESVKRMLEEDPALIDALIRALEPHRQGSLAEEVTGE
ncbi:hypothetical protein [Micromonospora sp. WMMD998]|uniref:hypothetical protein n=1 Tax=Micromonospora sp. WMMD998 TaxID=3016092 RepID=UPI002499DBC3|nr:hypothetical protein [Micromonospora sp. WMMD998]WFE38153.1 hypothetical protein O7619_06795 [Micromonospora sp. WMMD998]